MIAKILLGVAVIVGLGVWVVSALYPTVTKRVRVDVVLDFEGRQLAGSTIWHIKAVEPSINWGALKFKFDVIGEAIAIPVSESEALFVLRRGRDWVPTIGFGGEMLLRCVGTNELSGLASFQGTCRSPDVPPEIVLARGELSKDQLPELQFGKLGPLGTGQVKVLSLTMTTTDVPVEANLVSKFPWVAHLSKPNDGRQGMAKYDGSFDGDELYTMDFSKEDWNS